MSATNGSLLVGQSRAMRALRAAIADVAPTGLSVLIVGPTGAGKELVAREIHRLSACAGEFVSLNVCAVQETMFEATLFGHTKGAFTGAVRDVTGLLGEAHRGSLLLDEIGGLPRSLQLKLLRVIEIRVYRPVGGRHDLRSDFRTLAATNENIPALVATGGFREDLLERLSGFIIAVPPLAERRDDIPMLVQSYLEEQRADAGTGGMVTELTDGALSLLLEREWPRNVRELRNVLGRARAIAKGPWITREHLALACRHVHDLDITDSSGWELSGLNGADLKARERLVALLGRVNGDTKAAAQELKVDRVTVYRWMKRLRIPTGGRQLPRWLSEDTATGSDRSL